MSLPACTPLKLTWRMFAEQRKRLSKKLGEPKNAFAVYQGSTDVPRNTSDTSYSYRQDSYFVHLFGLEVADCLAAVNLANGEGYIFIPRLPDEYAVWMGTLPTPADIKAKTQVDHVFYTDEVAKVLKEQNCQTVHVLDGKNSDSGLAAVQPSFAGMDQFAVEKGRLFNAHTELRVTKTDLECEFFGALNKIASAAHVYVMQTAVKPGNYENQMEAAFLGYMMAAAQCKALAYGAIAGSGKGTAILHYVDNDRQMQDGEIILVDFGGERHNFASDITCSYPVNGKFTDVQRIVYEGVLAAHDAVIAALKPGVMWQDMHLLAMRIVGRMLRDGLGVLRGTDEEIEQSEVIAAFLPHGLGHLIGLEVHDVGGYMEGTPARGTSPMLKKLRTARRMEPGVLVTVEPGCYFNAVTLEAALKNPAQAKLIDEAKLRDPALWNFGGIRIESNVRITEDGCHNYTNVPRKVADIEAVMAGGSWPTTA